MHPTALLRLRSTRPLLETLIIPAPPRPAASATAYLVSRTRSNRLPVYLRTQAGGSKITTLIRRVEGDPLALRDEVKGLVGMEGRDVVVNPTTGHVVIKVGFQSQSTGGRGQGRRRTVR